VSAVPTPTAPEVLFSTVCRTPVGRLTLVASSLGLRAALWTGDLDRRVRIENDVVEDGAHPVVAAARVQLAEYFEGTRTNFDLPLDLHGTTFQVRAWRALTEIPLGETRTYGEQARALGLTAGGARAVGAANGRNPISIVVPCHRLVGATGALTGFAGGLEVKRALLAHERDRSAEASR
jgi:methylated-DNA-[protein]-cysteine S-methyltransferase